MGTLLPADATRDKRSMLITQVAALEGWYRCQSLDIWRQTPCKDLLGRQPGHAAELQRHTRSLVLPDSQRTYKKRPIRPKETTRRVRHTATPSPSVPRAGGDGACKTAALGDALLGNATIGNIQDRVLRFFGRAFHAQEFATRRPSAFRSAPSPPGKQLHTLLYISTTPIHPLLGRKFKPQLAACKTLAQQAGGAAAARAWPTTSIGRIRSAAKISCLISSQKLPAP